MWTIITALLCLIAGLLLRPKLVALINKRIVRTFSQDIHRYELEFQIQFYSQPSTHQVGANGKLTKLEPIKINIDARNEKEAIAIFADIAKHEIRTDLLSVTQVF
jgi:hypothetical protein